MPLDETRCVAKVADDAGWHFYQCQRKRGHGPDGKYCWQHAKRFEPKPPVKKKRDIFTIVSEIKDLMWGPGGCDKNCNYCPVQVDENDYDPEICFIKAMRAVFDPEFMASQDYTEKR